MGQKWHNAGYSQWFGNLLQVKLVIAVLSENFHWCQWSTPLSDTQELGFLLPLALCSCFEHLQSWKTTAILTGCPLCLACRGRDRSKIFLYLSPSHSLKSMGCKHVFKAFSNANQNVSVSECLNRSHSAISIEHCHQLLQTFTHSLLSPVFWPAEAMPISLARLITFPGWSWFIDDLDITSTQVREENQCLQPDSKAAESKALQASMLAMRLDKDKLW